VTTDGRVLDTKEKVLAFLAELDEAANRTQLSDHLDWRHLDQRSGPAE